MAKPLGGATSPRPVGFCLVAWQPVKVSSRDGHPAKLGVTLEGQQASSAESEMLAPGQSCFCRAVVLVHVRHIALTIALVPFRNAPRENRSCLTEVARHGAAGEHPHVPAGRYPESKQLPKCRRGKPSVQLAMSHLQSTSRHRGRIYVGQGASF